MINFNRRKEDSMKRFQSELLYIALVAPIIIFGYGDLIAHALGWLTGSEIIIDM